MLVASGRYKRHLQRVGGTNVGSKGMGKWELKSGWCREGFGNWWGYKEPLD